MLLRKAPWVKCRKCNKCCENILRTKNQRNRITVIKLAAKPLILDLKQCKIRQNKPLKSEWE